MYEAYIDTINQCLEVIAIILFVIFTLAMTIGLIYFFAYFIHEMIIDPIKYGIELIYHRIHDSSWEFNEWLRNNN